MERFVNFKKDVDFIGRSVAEAERANPPARTLVTYEVDADDADVVAYEPVFIDGKVQGFCTSGGYSHHQQKSIAMALIPRAHAQTGAQVEIEIMGKMRRAVQVDPSFDSEMSKMRS
jgi:dimethylglycine dehydrogenase